MPSCATDPCWSLWAYYTGAALNSRLAVTLIGVSAAAALAWWYQRENKIMEFRFETFKDMAANLTDCCRQARLVRAPAMYIEQMISLGGAPGMALSGIEKQVALLGVERARLGEMANTAFAIWQRLHPPIFSEKVSAPWFSMHEFFRKYAEDPSAPDFNKRYEKAMEDGSAALLEARKEIGMPYWQTKLMLDLERKHAGEIALDGKDSKEA